ncbi:MAG: hypothetical protein LBV51_03000 [Acholeplasmatales bacterium]|jgi:hypothetical protein|nr:hypothetical protein [Acholeplasmatales bacterium]
MFIKLVKVKSNNTHYVQVVTSYRDINNKVKHKLIKTYGILEDLILTNPYFLEELKEEIKNKTLEDSKDIQILNIGYLLIKKILFDYLKINSFYNNSTSNSVLYYIMSSILNNDSKTIYYKHKFNNILPYQLLLDELNHSYSTFIPYLTNIILNNNLISLDSVYCYVHNYNLFDVDLYRLSLSDNKRSGIALIVSNDIPLSYLQINSYKDLSVFKPFTDKIKSLYNIPSITLVGNKLSNTTSNFEFLFSSENKYIISKSVEHSNHHLFLLLDDNTTYIYNKEGTFGYKLVDLTRKISVKTLTNKIIEKNINEHVICIKINNVFINNNQSNAIKNISKTIIDNNLFSNLTTFPIKYYSNMVTTEDGKNVSGYYIFTTNDLSLTPAQIIQTYNKTYDLETIFNSTSYNNKDDVINYLTALIKELIKKHYNIDTNELNSDIIKADIILVDNKYVYIQNNNIINKLLNVTLKNTYYTLFEFEKIFK